VIDVVMTDGMYKADILPIADVDRCMDTIRQ
jgi:hypothetical protein